MIISSSLISNKQKKIREQKFKKKIGKKKQNYIIQKINCKKKYVQVVPVDRQTKFFSEYKVHIYLQTNYICDVFLFTVILDGLVKFSLDL